MVRINMNAVKGDPENFKSIINLAIQSVFPHTDIEGLKRTKQINDLMDDAINNNEGILDLKENEVEFLRMVMNKTKDWKNSELNAEGVLLTLKAVEDGTVISEV